MKDYTDLEPIKFNGSTDYRFFNVLTKGHYDVYEQRDVSDLTRLVCYEIHRNKRHWKSVMNKDRVIELINTPFQPFIK